MSTDIAQAAESAEKAKKVNWDKLDVGIEHVGRAITLPGDPAKMPLEKAVEALNRRIKEDNQPYEIHEIIDGYALDAAVAFVKAMARLYGWASPVSTPTFFGPKPPQFLSVKTGPGLDEVVQCPLGGFRLPGIDELVQTLIGPYGKGRTPAFVVHCTVKKKDRHILLELANLARQIVREESIYRGKAIRLVMGDDDTLDVSSPPEFLDVSDTSESSLIFDVDIQDQINTNILVPIKHTASCRKLKIPLKRGILLEGPYGTGKSLTARMTANVCLQNGWTFILLDRVQGLRVALEFAKMFAPAVVFAEDIDRIASERDEEANDLINIIDGVVSKSVQIMTILTTNFADKLNPVILRPGRLDAVISLRAPSAEAVKGLLKMYAGNLLPDDADLSGAGKELAGQIPASIRECVERAKLGMVGRGATTLVDRDLVISAQTMKNHLSLLNKDSKKPSDAEILAESLHKVVSRGNGYDPTQDLLESIDNVVCCVHNTVDEVHDGVEKIKRSVC